MDRVDETVRKTMEEREIVYEGGVWVFKRGAQQ